MILRTLVNLALALLAASISLMILAEESRACDCCSAPTKASPARSCPCPLQCQCGCQEGKPCGQLCDWPGRKRVLAPVVPATPVVPAIPAKPSKPEPASACNCSGDCPCPSKDPCPCRETAVPCNPHCTCVLAAKRKKLAATSEAHQNFGVETGQLSDSDTPTYRRRGQEITREEAVRILGKAVPDDSALLRLTIIGPEAERKQVLADLQSHASLAALRSKVVVQAYSPTDPLIKGMGFATGGRPTVYIQAPDGRVLHRQDEYRGPELLAEAVRKADPAYDPNRDPDLNKPPVNPSSPSATPLSLDLAKVPLPAWIVGGLGALLLLANLKRP
jgi:hypothetical protein